MKLIPEHMQLLKNRYFTLSFQILAVVQKSTLIHAWVPLKLQWMLNVFLSVILNRSHPFLQPFCQKRILENRREKTPTKASERNSQVFFIKWFSIFHYNLCVKMATSCVFHEFSKISVDIGNFQMEKLNFWENFCWP